MATGGASPTTTSTPQMIASTRASLCLIATPLGQLKRLCVQHAAAPRDPRIAVAVATWLVR
ncbi:hypothetical protein GCM10027199_79130 [Amycolatopsis magusensis]